MSETGGAPAGRRGLLALASVSWTYYAYAGLFGTYAPLWFHSLGGGALQVGALAALQSSTRLYSPYAWGWLADHTGRRSQLLRWGCAAALVAGVAMFGASGWIRIGALSWLLAVCTAGVVPISEAALAQQLLRDGVLDVRRYGRVRVWGSIGFIVAVVASGATLQSWGMQVFPTLLVAALALLLLAVWQLPGWLNMVAAGAAPSGAWAVLRQPKVAWFFAGVFLTVLAHTGLYAFLSLYLESLGYGRTAVGLVWAVGVVAEVGWFWFQGNTHARRTDHAWLTLAAGVSALRFALLAGFGAVPALLLATQCTHALTFAAQHSACVSVLNRHFPGRLRGRGQALYATLGYGASGVVGGLAGGAVSQAYGYAAVFWAASAVSLAAALCAARAGVLERRSAQT